MPMPTDEPMPTVPVPAMPVPAMPEPTEPRAPTVPTPTMSAPAAEVEMDVECDGDDEHDFIEDVDKV